MLLRAPRPAGGELWREYGWRAAPDPALIAAEHEALCTLLEDAGAEVVLAETPVEPNPDAVYVFDPAIVCDRGGIVLRPGKELRLAEADAIALDLEAAGVPVVARLEAPATAEGGDTLWLDERTLLVGRGYRTNPPGSRRCATRSPSRRPRLTTCRTGAAAPRSCTSSPCSRRSRPTSRSATRR